MYKQQTNGHGCWMMERKKEKRKEARSEERKMSWWGFYLQSALGCKSHHPDRESLYPDNRRPSTEAVLPDNSTHHQQTRSFLPCHVQPSHLADKWDQRTDVAQLHALPQLSGLPLLVHAGNSTTRAQVAPRVSTQWCCMLVFEPGRYPVQTGFCRGRSIRDT